jgi:hypothetical protein
MRPAPGVIDGARVVRWSHIDARHRVTGTCRHIVAGRLIGPPFGVAICQHRDEPSFYLFYCDAQWSPITDTCHETLEQACEQAEYEFAGISATWT